MLQVKYHGIRRFKLLAVDNEQKPYPVAAATWLDDISEGATEVQDELTAELERDVYGLLQQVVRYSEKLAPEDGNSSTSNKGLSLLPDTVLLYAPPPPDKNKQRGVADYMIKAGVYTAHALHSKVLHLSSVSVVADGAADIERLLLCSYPVLKACCTNRKQD